jgi:hypothetical protein
MSREHIQGLYVSKPWPDWIALLNHPDHDRIKMDKEDKKDEEDMEEDEEGEEGKDKKKKKDEEKSEVVETVLLEAVPSFTLEQLAEVYRSANTDVVQRLDILISALSQSVAPSGVPQRRSLTPPPNYAPPAAPQRDPNKPMTISEMVHKSVMG